MPLDILVLYINPFDHPLIWEGHGSVIDELKSDLNGIKPSLIICSVGGGGLLLGILNGLKRNDWNDVPGKIFQKPVPSMLRTNQNRLFSFGNGDIWRRKSQRSCQSR